MAELSARSGVPIPTIRYYMREGLVEPGELTSPNQASYEDSHVRALKLVRTLVEVGGLSIARVRAVLEFIRSKDARVFPTLGGVQYALTQERDVVRDDVYEAAEAQVEQLIAERRWEIRPHNPARTSLADAIATLTRLGHDDVIDKLGAYADAAHQLAQREVPDLFERDSVESLAEGVIAYDILGDAMLSALRRLAQENETAARISADGAR